MSEPTINDMMLAYSKDAVDFAQQNFNIDLDYSNESIRYLEKIAEELHKSMKSSFFGKLFGKTPNEEEIDTVCKMLGGYFGEVYLKNMPGTWEVNEELGVLGIRHEDAWIFPPSKTHKRLLNGAEDNLESYFQVALMQPWNKE